MDGDEAREVVPNVGNDGSADVRARMKVVAVGESMPADDAALARAARTDAAAFDPLYRRHYDRVYRYVRASLGHDEDAADVAQQVFVQAWRSLGRFEGRCSFATWLFRIAHNAVVDAQRRRRAALSWERLPADEQPTDASGPEEQAIRWETADRLFRALDHLDAEKRALLMLRFAGQLSVAEIADVVGKRPAAVKKQLTRTLRFLKEHPDVPRS
jgi:RNA polymerase sigma factor (sigma-70 family)